MSSVYNEKEVLENVIHTGEVESKKDGDKPLITYWAWGNE